MNEQLIQARDSGVFTEQHLLSALINARLENSDFRFRIEEIFDEAARLNIAIGALLWDIGVMQ